MKQSDRHSRGLRMTEIPARRTAWEFLMRAIKTVEVLVFKLLQVLDLYHSEKSIVGVPSLATRNFTFLQAVVYNGTQEEVLGFRPRRLVHRILRGLPDLEMFERLRFQLSLGESHIRTIEGSTRGRGFLQLQVPWQWPWKPPRVAWLRVTPVGVDTLFGTVRLGEYEVKSAPVFFLTQDIRRIIISDIDDTIKDSRIAETTTFRQVMSGLFRGNYYRYEAIQGMSEVYQQLASEDTLIIYLTSTPFQLAPFLLKFLRDNRFPEGPVFTRWLGYGRFGHKFRTLTRILSQCEGQKVYLIGDSGEEDLQIYRRVAEQSTFADKVEKILIRHVPGSQFPSLTGRREVLYGKIEELTQHFGISTPPDKIK